MAGELGKKYQYTWLQTHPAVKTGAALSLVAVVAGIAAMRVFGLRR